MGARHKTFLEIPPVQRRVAAADARKKAAQLLNHPFITPAQAAAVHNQIRSIGEWEVAAGHNEFSTTSAPIPQTPSLPPIPQVPALSPASEAPSAEPASPVTRAPVHHSIEVVDAVDVAES
jgi:hypothetical protein